jgi:hypothetical protein
MAAEGTGMGSEGNTGLQSCHFKAHPEDQMGFTATGTYHRSLCIYLFILFFICLFVFEAVSHY